jgi:hypothetical protein
LVLAKLATDKVTLLRFTLGAEPDGLKFMPVIVIWLPLAVAVKMAGVEDAPLAPTAKRTSKKSAHTGRKNLGYIFVSPFPYGRNQLKPGYSPLLLIRHPNAGAVENQPQIAA